MPNLVQHVFNQLNLIRYLGTAEDGKEWPLGILKGLCKVLEFLLHKETGCSLGEFYSNHARMGTMGSAEGIIDINVAEFSEIFPEISDASGICLYLGSVFVLD